jgi:hypothetical protein
MQNTPYKIERLEPGEEQTLGPSPWGVLSNGFALFRAGIILSGVIHYSSSSGHTRETFRYAKLYKDAENEIIPDVSFYSIFGQQADEFYQLWAVWLAMIALWVLVLENKGLNFTIGWIFILFGVWLFNTLAIPRLKEIK